MLSLLLRTTYSVLTHSPKANEVSIYKILHLPSATGWFIHLYIVIMKGSVIKYRSANQLSDMVYSPKLSVAHFEVSLPAQLLTMQ